MEKTEYQVIDARFRSVFESHAVLLSKDARENVQHLVDAGEIEMACESFVVSLLEEQVPLAVDVRKELRDLAIALQLDRESVFRGDFWHIARPVLDSER